MAAMIGSKLILALKARGILPAEAMVRRVLIDAQMDQATRVYFECIGDEQLIEVDGSKVIGLAQVIRATDLAKEQVNPADLVDWSAHEDQPQVRCCCVCGAVYLSHYIRRMDEDDNQVTITRAPCTGCGRQIGNVKIIKRQKPDQEHHG